MELLIATTNKDKIREMKEMLNGMEFNIKTLDDYPKINEPIEDGKTFEENAIIKAKYYYKKIGIPTISDDSGLEILNLNNFPGVNSKRWMAGTYFDKSKKLYEMLNGKDSSAKYQCSIAYINKNEIKIFNGESLGILLPKDEHNGFGYDPYIISKDLNKYFNDIPSEEKNKISHRGKSLRKFKKYIMK